jgi:hypothetical protein
MKTPLAFTLLTATASVAGIVAVATTPDTISAPLTPEGAACVEGTNVSALFAPGTDPKIVEMVSQAIQNLDNADNSRYQTTTRWPGAAGTPVNLTYSFPSDGITIPNGVGEGSGPNGLHAFLTGDFGSEAAWKAKFAQAFAQWGELTGNTYTEVSDDDAPFFNSPGPLHGGSGRGDIRIAAKFMDGGGGVLGYNFFPGSTGGDMVLDRNENWGSSFNDFRFFRNTVTHEHGHGQGILHVCPIQGNKLMEPFLNTSFDGPQHDDIRATTVLYGDRYEPNGSTGSAAFIGFFDSDGSFSDIDLCLRNSSDDDFFSIDVDGAAHIDVAADPFGFSYPSGPQTQQCNSGTTINTNTLLDPTITVFDTDGTTVLASGNTAGLGVVETLSNVALPSAGTYFIRVDGAGGFGNTGQIYDLDVDVTIDPVVGCVADLNGDGIVDTADLGILLGNFAGVGVGDLNGDTVVDTADLGILLGVFGGCTPL